MEINRNISISKNNIKMMRAIAWMIIVMCWLWSIRLYDWIYIDQVIPAILIITIVLLIRDTPIRDNHKFNIK